MCSEQGGQLYHIRSLAQGIELPGCKKATVIAAETSGHWTVGSRQVFHRLWESEWLETAQGQRSHDSFWPYHICGINAGLCCWPYPRAATRTVALFCFLPQCLCSSHLSIRVIAAQNDHGGVSASLAPSSAARWVKECFHSVALPTETVKIVICWHTRLIMFYTIYPYSTTL